MSDVHRDVTDRVEVIARVCRKCRQPMKFSNCAWACALCWHIEPATEDECRDEPDTFEAKRRRSIANVISKLRRHDGDVWRFFPTDVDAVIAADPLTAQHEKTAALLGDVKKLFDEWKEAEITCKSDSDFIVTMVQQLADKRDALLSRIEGDGK